jgi:hypothetical protein
MSLLIRLLGSVSLVLVAACAQHPGDFPVSHNEVTHCYPAVIPQLSGRLEMPGHEVADYFSEKWIVKRPLGDLGEWSGKFDVEEGDSDWNSWVEIRFEQGADEKTGKKAWFASGVFLDGWDESKKVPFSRLPVLMLDEDGSAFFKIGKRRCYLFRHATRGCILVIESGFYEKVH